MIIAHISDLHLGATLRSFSRAFEHRRFLAWLLDRLAAEAVDALLVTGDVFDNQNPPAAAQELFYDFLVEAHRRLPRLQVVVIGGNHDSGHRLEAPAGLMRRFRAHVVGSLPRDADGRPDPAAVVLPLEGPAGAVEAWCVAMPFLRPADLPTGCGSSHLDVVAGTRALYDQALAAARRRAGPGSSALLALGHCFMAAGLASADSERPILVGGEAALPPDLFPRDLAYVGLGHLHRPQTVGGRAELVYAGSPLPMSLAERGYRHRLVLVEIADGVRRAVRYVAVPRWVDMLRIPDHGALPPDALLAALAAFAPDADADSQPFLEVAVELAAPEPGLRARIEAALDGKPVRLVRITEVRPGAAAVVDRDFGDLVDLDALDPRALFRRRWARDYPGEPPPPVARAFEALLVESGLAPLDAA